MSWKEDYQSKLVSVEEAVSKVKDGDRLWYGAIVSSPVDLGIALGKRTQELHDVTVYSGLNLYPYEFMRGTAKGHMTYECLFLGPLERKFYPEGNINITSYNFAHCDNMTRNIIKPTIAMFEVSEPNEEGLMSFGTIGCYNGYAISEEADTVIVQVNKNVPFIPGCREAFLHVSEVDYIVEKDHPLPELSNPPITEADVAIGKFVADEIPDGACLQIGLGAIPDAVLAQLKNKKHLSSHAEMISTNFVDLVECGALDCSQKNFHPGKIVTPMAPGTNRLTQFCNNNDMLEFHPISWVNDPRIASQNDNLCCVNGTLMVDLTGQACSESIGHTPISGTGGQLDYAIAADLSKGGKNFLCLHSALQGKDGKLESRIVSKFPEGTVVTTPRSLMNYVVTEYGIVDLRDKSIPERVKLMISIAHPDLREQLHKEAVEAGLLLE